jgi:hypothetical protein
MSWLAKALVASGWMIALALVPAAQVDADSARVERVSHLAATAVVADYPDCCEKRCIRYRHHKLGRKCVSACEPQVEVILKVLDPCRCCYVDVPVCLPACCAAESPELCMRSGIFKREVVEYAWSCGVRVKVVFDRRGDLTVHTYGF